MTKIDFGVGISMPVKPDKREHAERFCQEVLALPQIMKSDQYTCFKFPNGQVLGICSDENALSEEEYEKSAWLEIVTSNFNDTLERVKSFGVREVKGGMKEAFFFNIPGGVVFRLISEELAKEMSQQS